MSAAVENVFEAVSTLDAARPAIELVANSYQVVTDDRTISTVLGSCIAVCLTDPAAGVGGMNHFMLPGAAGRSLTGKPAALRYGPNAMNALLAALYAAGAQHDRLQARIFGGAGLLVGRAASAVGAANIEYALGDLGARGITLVAQDVGGRWPRRLYYRPASGEARVRRFARILPSAFDPATGACMLRRAAPFQAPSTALVAARAP